MEAARLTELGANLTLKTMPDPAIHADGVRIDVESAHVATFTKGNLAGEGAFEPSPPITPGPSAVGVVNAVGEGVTGVEIGDRVFCDPRVVSRTNGGPSIGMLTGWFGYTPNADTLLERWGDGSYAEQTCYPAECVTVLDGAEAADVAALANLNPLGTAYGALEAGDIEVGDRVAVNGATGQLGSFAVLVALAAGASGVAAIGRDQDDLDTLDALDDRVTTVSAAGEHDTGNITETAGEADLVVDFLGSVDTAAPTRAALGALVPGGTAVFAGGVSTEVPVPYLQLLGADQTITGSFMYRRSVPARLFDMVTSNVLPIDAIRTETFPLSAINEAIDVAADGAALESVVVTPTA